MPTGLVVLLAILLTILLAILLAMAMMMMTTATSGYDPTQTPQQG